MATTPCFCGHYRLNPEHAVYVKDGRPLCNAITCERAALRTHHSELHRDADRVRETADAAA